MQRLLQFSTRRPATVLILALLITAGFGSFIPRVNIELNARSLIPSGHPQLRNSRLAEERFPITDGVVLVIECADESSTVFDAPASTAVIQVTAALRRLETIVPHSITSLASVPAVWIEDEVVQIDSLLGGVLCAQRAQRIAVERGFPRKVLLSEDLRTTAIFAETRSGAKVHQLLQGIREIAQENASDDVKIWYSGNALAQATLGRYSAIDLAKLIPIVVVVLSVSIYLLFSSIIPVCAALLEVGISLTITVGIFGIFEAPIFVTTLILPVLLVAVGVSDDIYAINACFRADCHGPEHVVEAVQTVGTPILFTAATTMTGLLSLLASPLLPQQIFGLFGAVAIALSTLMTFTVVPAVVVLAVRYLGQPIPARIRRRSQVMSRWTLSRIERFGPRRMFAAITFTLAIAAFACPHVRIDDSWMRNLPFASDIRDGDRHINASLLGTTRLDVMIDSGQTDAILDFARWNELETSMGQLPHVKGIEGPMKQVAIICAAMDEQTYDQWLAKFSSDGALTSDLEVEQAFMLQDSLNIPGNRRTDETFRHAHVTLFVEDANYTKIKQTIESCRKLAETSGFGSDTVTFFGDGWYSFATVDLLVTGQVRSIGTALVSDIFLLTIVFASLRTAVLAIAPVVLSIVLVFSMLPVIGIQLGIASSMFATLSLGFGVDYAIHLVSRFRECLPTSRSKRQAIAAAYHQTFFAIISSCLSITAGFSVLMFSSVPPNAELGILMCISIFICAIVVLSVMPVLLRLVAKQQ